MGKTDKKQIRLNSKDFILISYLRKDARKNITKMSRVTGIPISTIFDKIKKYKKSVIERFTSLINFKALGYDIRVNMILRVDRNDKGVMENFLLKHENINSVLKIASGYDFLVDAVFKDMGEFENFVSLLDKRFNIIDRKEYFIFNELKREAFLSDPKIAHLLLD